MSPTGPPSSNRTSSSRARPTAATLALVVRALLTRLRFLIVLGAMLAVVANWDRVRSTWERWTTSSLHDEPVGSDIEYFCPMDPGVLSDWPEKCPVCNMTLVTRKKGEMTPLPDGTLARMQFSPERLALGGVETAPVAFEPLSIRVEAVGTVSAGTDPTVEFELFQRDAGWLNAASRFEVECPVHGQPLARPERIGAELLDSVHPERGDARRVPQADLFVTRLHLRLLSRAQDQAPLTPGQRVGVRIETPVASFEPFASQPTEPPPLFAGEPRRAYRCMEHASSVSQQPGKCPLDLQPLMAHALLDNQRLRWWCPMHPEVTADRAGQQCEPCGGMPLVARIVTFRPPGTVPCVPASALIGDAQKSVVYVDRGGGLFEGRLVVAGPRCGAKVPIVSGLEPDDHVAARGAFLLDAETQLNPALAGTYFGSGSRGRKSSAATAAKPGPGSANASADQDAIERQRICPVTRKRLGSMGQPVRVEHKGKPVFLCCDGCIEAFQGDPETYLERLAEPRAEPQP